MPNKKIVCLGEWSSYFTGTLGDLAARKGLKGRERLFFMRSM